MPTDTFMKLSPEKKEKIIVAAKKEFARVPFEETSIKNIIEDAGIARGSFYQYFATKEELLNYIMFDHMKKVEEVLQETLEKTKGDIFQVFIRMYDYMTNEIFTQTDCSFHKRIFENIKTSEDTLFTIRPMQDEFKGPFSKTEVFGLIDSSKLKIQKEEDVNTIIQMLYVITRKALVSNFKYDYKEQARKEYIKQIEYLKYGICKK